MSQKALTVLSAFAGYLWHFSFFLIIVPMLVYYLGTQLDSLVRYLIFKTDAIFELKTPFLIGGMIIILLGAALIVWASITLSKRAKCFPFETINMKEFHPKQLAIQGPYAYVRNPMLLGYGIMLVGGGIILTSPFSVFWTIPLFLWASYEYVEVYEEKRLYSWFGEEYQKYHDTTPFLFPRIGALLRMEKITHKETHKNKK